MKNNKGITMISLVITIIVLIIVTSVTIYNGTAQLGIKRVNNLYADIDSISTKVAEYYLKNEKLPVFENEYIDSKKNLEKLFRENGATTNITNANDGDDYYVLDLSKLDNLTLNYGDEYKDWTSTSSANDIQNIYIINSVTHQIYFPHGVRSGKDYYFARFPDEDEVPKIELEDIDDEWSVTINSISPNKIDENNITILAEVTLNGILENYNLNSLEYAWTETNVESELENISFTKFYVNEEDKTATITSKALSNTAENYYLWVKLLDINGKVNYQKIRNSASPLTGNLPSNYQKVEYIESNGTQWIDTKCIATYDNKFGVSMKIKLTSDRGKESSTLALTGANVSWGNGFSISQNIEDANSKNARACYGKYTISTVQMNTNEIYNISNIDGTFKINDNTYSITKTNSGFVTGSVLLFGLRRGTSVQNITLSSCKMYEAKVYTNDAIVRNFIPCYRKADNVNGLYDLVEGEFYTNQATTGNDFVAGNDI